MRGDNVKILIDEIRSSVDELNKDNLSDEDLLMAVNLAYAQANTVLASSYPAPLLRQQLVTIPVNTQEYTLPENIFGDRVFLAQWVKLDSNGNDLDVFELSKTSLATLGRAGGKTDNFPNYFAQYERKIRFSSPVRASGMYLRLWLMASPEKLVLPFGRIVNIDADAKTLYLVDVNEEYDYTQSDYSYVNVIDGWTGLVKTSLQIKDFNGTDTVEFKTVPDASMVLNMTIGSDFTEIARDDYLCFVVGTCVMPFSESSIRNYVFQRALAHIKREHLGYPYSQTDILAKELLASIRKEYAGRPQATRIKMINGIFSAGSNSRSRFRR